MMLAIDPKLFPEVQGSTDSEVVFHLALTFGREVDPIGALEQAVGLIVSEPFSDLPGAREGVTVVRR